MITNGESWLLSTIPRWGKSQLALRWLTAKALSETTAVVLFDPPGTLASDFIKLLAFHGQLSRVVWDRIADPRCPGYSFLTPATGPDREQLDFVSCTNFKSIILQHEGKRDARENQAISEGLDLYTGIQITLPHVPPYWFEDAFSPVTAEHKIIAAGLEEAARLAVSTHERIQREKLLRKFLVWSKMKGPPWLMYPGALVRRLRVLTRPVVRNHWGQSFGLTEHLNHNRIWIMSGDLTGRIDAESQRFLFNMGFLKVVQHHRGGAETNTYCVSDEIVKADYLSAHYTDALFELPKTGLSLITLAQNAARMSEDPQIQSDMIGGNFLAIGRQQGDGAKLTARMISSAILDPKKVRYTEETWQNVIRQVPEKYKTVTKHSGDKKSVTEGERLVNIHDRELQRRDVHFSFDDQDRLIEQRLMNAEKGVFYFATATGVTPEPIYVPLLKQPFQGFPTYQKAFFDKACQLIFAGPAYRTPVIQEAEWNDPPPPPTPEFPVNPQPPKNGPTNSGQERKRSGMRKQPNSPRRS